MTHAFIGRPSQAPDPGGHLLFHRGDLARFKLTLHRPHPGTAWLRTNIGHAAPRRAEIIREAEQGIPALAMDWHDIPMRPVDNTHFVIHIPLTEVGRFEAKTFFLPEGTVEPVWPDGPNTLIKVEPAEYVCSSSIYNAFVRQFGENQRHRDRNREAENMAESLDLLGYTVIPRSGTFRDLIRELDFITGTLGFRVIQLLPIHPAPTTFGRMGRFGSPFAALDLRAVDPSLADFDRRTTPLQQFHELVDAIHRRSARIFLDIPVNHTGWASRLQAEHPEWFVRNPDGSFHSPEVWGVKWEDLSKLDYSRLGLWEEMAGMFLHWCRIGVDGFRCDAGYMVPAPVWRYITARVREEYPDTIFLLEGLGGKIETTEELLTDSNLDWAYSELFQNYDRSQIGWYLPDCIHLSTTRGVHVHFAETHDNNRLAARSPSYSRMRTALSALVAHNGAFGITNGVEWFATEKVDVHGAPSLNWGAPDNQIAALARLNSLLATHPAFHANARVRLMQHSQFNSLAMLREPGSSASGVLVLINLSDTHSSAAVWNTADFSTEGRHALDLLTGRTVPIEHHPDQSACQLSPGEALCLTLDPAALAAVDAAAPRHGFPIRALHQQWRAKALEIHTHYRGITDLNEDDVDTWAAQLAASPADFCRERADRGDAPAITTWTWPRDIHRTVMVPPGHFLLVRADHPFSVDLTLGDRVLRHEESLPSSGNDHFALLSTPRTDSAAGATRLHAGIRLTVHEPDSTRHDEGEVLFLPDVEHAQVFLAAGHAAAIGDDDYALCTNGSGGMAQVRAAWGEIRSQYDAFLAANLNPDFPVDRRVLFTRCRGWILRRGYSQEINRDSLLRFTSQSDGVVRWDFNMPAGTGRMIPLSIRLSMKHGSNAISLEFTRSHTAEAPPWLPDTEPVSLILRPDVEDRSNHGSTRAFTGPEQAWPASVRPSPDGFAFGASGDYHLAMHLAPGSFTHEPVWTYMVATPFDAARGLSPHTDLFSPGYFAVELSGGQSTTLRAEVVASTPLAPTPPPPPLPHPSDSTSLMEASHAALRHYVVKRHSYQTVIAGYPWFLDWGRDTLICLRGLIAAGYVDEARKILRQFARFEANGTLPNMICGDDCSNRDTTDAPLWFFVACEDLFCAEGSPAFLSDDCGGRSLWQILHSLAAGYQSGTPNGIRMDPDSGLIFSPPHFTWMDTNWPAGTPRQGYPIEIQALWHRALSFLARIEPEAPWAGLADRVRQSIHNLYTRADTGWLSDCLHADPGQAAAAATPDDHLRPNQLFTITLGAIREHALCASILSACEELLIPGAIRSLADRPVHQPLPIMRNGQSLNDPAKPYWGQYSGDEDTHRKPAYHNGTAWTWPFPSYSEALFLTYGEPVRPAALALLGSCAPLLSSGCLGHLPEVLDGNRPHLQRGAGAQAWGVTELYRVLAILQQVS